jgi:predicted DNA-binding transcriptional regulator YafY
MPSDAPRHTLARHWELLRLLPSHGTGRSALELTQSLNSAGFKVSKRQVERDLQSLSEIFAVESINKNPQGWRWAPNTPLDIPGLSLAEALSLKLARNMMSPLLPPSSLRALAPRFAQADAKLAALESGNATARWAAKVRTVPQTLPMLPPAIDAAILETVQEALFHDVQLDVAYRNLGADQAAAMRLHPLGLVARGVTLYLVATAFDYADPRTYALHRITQASRCFEAVKPPQDFSLDAYIAEGEFQFGNGQTLRLEAWVSESLARVLEETPLAADQSLALVEDVHYLTASVLDSWQLRWWLLSQGDEVIVVEPAELRAEIGETLESAAAFYREDQ